MIHSDSISETVKLDSEMHDENLLVGASPVVDFFAFVLENLANSALHRVSAEPLRRCVLRPGRFRVQLKCRVIRREVFML